MYLSGRCSELVAHINNTNTPYNLPAFRKKKDRDGRGSIAILVFGSMEEVFP
jgi:hypothetical protein